MRHALESEVGDLDKDSAMTLRRLCDDSAHTLRRTAIRCNTLRRTATRCNTLYMMGAIGKSLLHLQHTAPCCNSLYLMGAIGKRLLHEQLGVVLLLKLRQHVVLSGNLVNRFASSRL